MQRRLGHEPRRGPLVALPGVHEERMAQVDGAGFTRRQRLGPLGAHPTLRHFRL
jgi:hypothetical protein